MTCRSEIIIFGRIAFSADHLIASAELSTEPEAAYILSLESGNHPRHSLDNMTFNLELVIIRITFLYISVELSEMKELT